MAGLPTVIRAESRGEFRIRLVCNDGVEGTFDFSAWLEGPVFQALEDQAYFRRFFLEEGAATWPDGAALAPETLHERARASATA